MRCRALILVLALAAAGPVFAGSHVIPDVEPLDGPDPTVRCLARMIRIAVDPTMSDDDLYGLSGTAFLATVCSNNCTCRDYRELVLSVQHLMTKMGVEYEQFDGGDDALWEKIKASIDDGVPVLAWNLFGDFEDALMTGYDEEMDLAYGWGVAPAGDSYHTAALSRWKGGGMFGYLVKRGKFEGDRKQLEMDQLGFIVRMAHRPPMEGG